MKCKIFKFSTLPTKEEGRSNILGMPEQDENHKWKCLNVLAEINIQASLRCWEEAVPGVGGVRLTTGVAVEHGSVPHLTQGQPGSVDTRQKVITVTGGGPTHWNTRPGQTETLRHIVKMFQTHTTYVSSFGITYFSYFSGDYHFLWYL